MLPTPPLFKIPWRAKQCHWTDIPWKGISALFSDSDESEYVWSEQQKQPDIGPDDKYESEYNYWVYKDWDKNEPVKNIKILKLLI